MNRPLNLPQMLAVALAIIVIGGAALLLLPNPNSL